MPIDGFNIYEFQRKLKTFGLNVMLGVGKMSLGSMCVERAREQGAKAAWPATANKATWGERKPGQALAPILSAWWPS